MTRQINLIANDPVEFYEQGDFFRLLSAVNPITVEFYSQGREISEAVGISKGYAEKFNRGTFDRLRVVSATTQAVQLVTRLGNEVQYDAAPVGDTAIISSVPLNLTAASIDALNNPVAPTTNWNSTVAVGLTPLTVFTPAANVNGAILLKAEFIDYAPNFQMQTFLAKSIAPVSYFDGDVLLQTTRAIYAGTNWKVSANVHTAQYIAPGLGLYFISSVAGATNAGRSCRYRLL